MAAARGGNHEDATPGCLLRRIRRRAVCSGSYWRSVVGSNHRSVSAGSRVATGPVTSPATLHMAGLSRQSVIPGRPFIPQQGALRGTLCVSSRYPLVSRFQKMLGQMSPAQDDSGDQRWRRQEDSNPHGCYTLSVFWTGRLPVRVCRLRSPRLSGVSAIQSKRLPWATQSTYMGYVRRVLLLPLAGLEPAS